MRLRHTALLLTFAGLAAPAAASANCVHVVTPGETLTSIAAADGISIDQLAAANGLPPANALLAGICLTIPPQTEPAVFSSGPSTATSAPSSSVDGDGDSDGDVAASAPSTSSTAGGSYVVQPGDTLTAIAARAGLSLSALSAANGIDPAAPLFVGTVLRLSGSGAPTSSTAAPASSSSASAATSQPVGAAAEGSAVNPPYPTAQTLSAGEIGQIAAYEGVPPALAEAIAYQESGFNNNEVSTADARGIMQILPGTWSWIGQNLATPPPLGTASAAQNMRAGTLLLHSLLQATGGNQQLAAAGYFQGLPSVEQNGEYPATQQYVNDVMSLAQRFGGG